ncbi:MAG: translation initiation factor IF-2, partial [Acidimicrobiales bacterium]
YGQRPGGYGSRPGAPPGGPAGGPGLGRGPGGPPGRGGPPLRGRPPQRRSSGRRRRRSMEELEPTQPTSYMPSNAPVPQGEIIVERGSSAQDLGPKLNRSAGDVVRFLLLQGEMVTATQALSDDMIELFAAELHADVRLVDPGEEQEAALQAKYFGEEQDEGDESLVQGRPAVITVMGHVDHGKTKLLDRIRETNVVAAEAGGITQHIGAYRVEVGDKVMTFIDTPGHEAFTAMRARGAEVTDIVVLVVAADDGVMPQTVEAINHAKAAGVPIVVALNKIDREDADPNRVMQQLSEQGLVPEAWGGDTITVELSALQGIGIDDLLEQLLVLAEVLELRANPEGRARGVVLEANLDVGRGPVATVIVQSGRLDVGDSVVAGPAWGRVKALIDDRGASVKWAGPSTPVQVLGFSDVASAGDQLRVTGDLQTARMIGEQRGHRLRVAGYTATPSATPGAKLEDIFEQIQRGETATLNLILRADVQGSLEALTEALHRLERDEVKLSFVQRAVGGITENDVQLAAAANATIIGFNVRPDRRARELAVSLSVEIRTYEIIYKVLEEIEAAMVGMLAPELEEVVTGEAEVREVFRVPRVGAVAGCYVRSGTITRGSRVRFLREGVVIWKGAITSLRRFKDDVRDVQTGFECGVGLSDFQDLHSGDLIETFEEREIQRT